ncbi:hypothetical protein DCW30_04475 [Streptomyces alfalfae]|uniref:Uncharacterized protein n=1 Tax=Streptomyces alfalfae TaxID=1642299 RepID=A0ABM6GLR4_9ACTN|nr:hypothetical protein A7J05_00590 [Streptomyces alfalfae]AYA14975.1 hypothetical protein D3X13_00630 [Streptomyces fradiae]RXX46943.1 hypothetical protein DCW30_04475 [Streptomyces alfalfae]RZM81356.1 hypothetical protein D4104_35050 [Streptomyces alfalfae]
MQQLVPLLQAGQPTLVGRQSTGEATRSQRGDLGRIQVQRFRGEGVSGDGRCPACRLGRLAGLQAMTSSLKVPAARALRIPATT